MSCSPFDLRDYFLQELANPQQRQVEVHVKTCAPCREELDRLRITEAALRSMADEEIPQRIAFVSDKIFEPSPWRRWLAAFWNSGARLGFASAAMLSASLVLFALKPAPAPVIGVMRPAAPAAVTVTQTSAVPEAAVREAAVPEADIQRRIQAAVELAVDLKTKDLMKEIRSEHVRLMVATDQLEQDERRMRHMQVVAANFGLPAGDREDAK
jgi:anti-sigma factor RsiW